MKNFILAQATQATQPSNGMNYLVLGAIWLGIMYLLIIRPQRIKTKKHQESISSLKVGDTIITQGGIYGTIQKVESHTFIIQIANGVEVKIARASIQAFSNVEINK